MTMIILSNTEKKELIIKSWMTPDGIWFFHCLRKSGIEITF